MSYVHHHCLLGATHHSFKKLTITMSHAHGHCVPRGNKWALEEKTTMMRATHCHRPPRATTKFKEMMTTTSYACGCFPRGNKWSLKENTTTMSATHRRHLPKATTKFKETTTTTRSNTIPKKRVWKYFLLTFKVLISTHIQGRHLCMLCKLLTSPPLSTLLKVLFASSWSCGNSKPHEQNLNASSNGPCFSSTRYGGEWKRRNGAEWSRGRKVDGLEGGRAIGRLEG